MDPEHDLRDIRTWKRWFKTPAGKRCLAIVAVVAVLLGYIAWYKGFRVVPQPARITDDPAMRFKYGSLGSEEDYGIPYYVWLVLPRVFPDLLPGPGGYASFGFPWEPGEETPVGFSKKTMGFPRITNNCALCHTSMVRTEEDAERMFIATGPNHTARLQAYIRFISKASKDPRFNADEILAEIEPVVELDVIDKLFYRYLIIPITRDRLAARDADFDWMNLPGWTEWGPGRDDPMNLTKYFMTEMPVDDTIGNADFPSVWNLGIRQDHSMNWAGETESSRAVIIDSALGLGMPPTAANVSLAEDIDTWLQQVPPPPYPDDPDTRDAYDIDAALAARGRPIYQAQCASCHEAGGTYYGKVVAIDEIGTDRERLDTWSQAAADAANAKVASFGITRKDMVFRDGYVAQPLDGVWLRAPYLHNGAVPNLRALLRPASARPTDFYRGFDVYDPVNVGFMSSCADANARLKDGCAELKRVGTLFDTRRRGNGKGGHAYGTDLGAAEVDALIEYLKTL